MRTLDSLVSISTDEKPYINFESSIDNDQVISGYIPVRSTLEVFEFLKSAVSANSTEGRAVIAWGSYGTGKSRLCSVLARLFRDGFDAPPLLPIWDRLEAREEGKRLAELKQVMMPGGRSWRPWLVVPIYIDGGPGTLSAVLIRAVARALRQNGLDDSVLGMTIYHAAAHRLEKMVAGGAQFIVPPGAVYSTPEQLARELLDFDEEALRQFKEYHESITVGISFEEYVRSEGGTSMEAFEVYNTVAERIQQHGYDGILVLWDEFGFAIEELLRGGRSGKRSLGQEVMGLQNFVERSCTASGIGKKVVFIGFTHVGLSEYGSREGLGETDQKRLATVKDRFRNPSIPIRLGMAENEGYHLLSGFLRRTETGKEMFVNPVPNMQRIANCMTKLSIWREMSATACYNDIAAPCYPMHPATAVSLLVLSNQIAQESRTTFYFLQNRSEGGLGAYLSKVEVPALENVGSAELMRPNQLFRFFEQAIAEGKSDLYDQYREAVARFPNAADLQIAILQTVLILFVIANPEMSPTSEFLCFCYSDHLREDAAASVVLNALEGLRRANVLWKNEATDVWSFVGRRGVNSEVEDALEQEQELVKQLSAPLLLLEYPEAQCELIDRLGDFSLEPAESGVVRRIGIQLLDIRRREKAVEDVNPARFSSGGSTPWRSALIYLVCTENAAQLDTWRERAAALQTQGIYFVFPPEPPKLSAEDLRKLIAIRNLLDKTPNDDHAYNVLEGMLTSLREKLRLVFGQSFGNAGLRSGTLIVQAGDANTSVPVASWNELLPSVAHDLDKEFIDQIRIRCGSFNEWKSDSRWSPVEGIVERILKFDETPQYQDRFLGFKETSEEAAIIDGVLIENDFLVEDALTQRWNLVLVDDQCVFPVLAFVLKHFRSGGSGKEYRLLYTSLVDAPYGIPNGIIPILVALVFRTEQARIGVYSKTPGGNLQGVSSSKMGNAITDMAKHPGKYVTRYTRLSGKQRFVFRVIGPLMGVPFTVNVASGEAFYDYCALVRSAMKSWVAKLPDSVQRLPDLSDSQRCLVGVLRGPVSPHISALADCLVAMVADVPAAASEAEDNGRQLDSYPATEALWSDFCTRVNRYVEGVKAPVRMAINKISAGSEGGDIYKKISQALVNLPGLTSQSTLKQAISRLEESSPCSDSLDAVVSAITDRPVSNLTEEDYGRTLGVIEVLDLLQGSGGYRVCLPSGQLIDLPLFVDQAALTRIEEDVESWQSELQLSPDQLAALVLKALYEKDISNEFKTTDSSDSKETLEIAQSVEG